MGQFKIKRVYEQTETGDGFRVLVDRLWPRGMTKERVGAEVWLKEVAPSPELCRWFGHVPERFEQFQASYAAELRDEAARPHVDQLRSWVKEQDVTLLYAAKDERHNQAIVLKRYLDGELPRE
ncbi:DUF488 family protein [Cohnella sp. LGH]|uniref:DUF488 domain-containing protein n=1 Tax=Cohnella sp. LGH TaxID=1619153 RepID=UPI001ADA30FA|nr:DUF488 family protein [Cohnella sp. LGH]QTH44587.1 DUF488 family protein [Cohnella sp. LGH]